MNRFASLVTAVCALAVPACVLEVDDGHGGGVSWDDAHGPRQPSTGPTTKCERDDQCGGGCYCDRKTWRCQTSTTCRRDADCKGGFVCDARSTCVPPTPTSDAGAPSMDTRPAADTRPAMDSGATPDAGAAPDAMPPSSDAGSGGAAPAPVYCRIDAQCGAGGKCVAGSCQRACVTSATCGTGQVCAEGRCQPSPTAGHECVFSAMCPGNGVCINGHCHAACSADAACARSGDFCDRGLCRPDGRPVPQCTSNATCPAGRMCVDAVCRTPCASDAQCGPGCSGTVCHGGFCVMPEELVPVAPPPVCGPAPTPTCP